MPICPVCQGAKESTAIYCPGGFMRTRVCGTCQGRGEVTEREYNCYMAGRMVRAVRVKELRQAGGRTCRSTLRIFTPVTGTRRKRTGGGTKPLQSRQSRRSRTTISIGSER